MARLSRYSLLVDENHGSALLFNARTGALIRLSAERRRELGGTGEITPEFADFLLQQGFLVHDDVDEVQLIVDAHETSRSNPEMFAATIELTEACNFRCSYCYQNHAPKHLSDRTAEKTIRYLVRKMRGVRHLHVNWFGGEPLLRLETMTRMSQRLAERARARECSFSQFITTNGYLLTPSVADELVELGIEQVQITLDGDEESHNRFRVLRSGKGTYKEVLEACKNVVSAGMQLMVRVNLNRRNAQRIDVMLSDIVSRGISPANAVIHVVRAIDHGNCSTGVSSMMFSNQQFAEQWVGILRTIAEYGFGLPTLAARAYNCTFDLLQTVMIGRDGSIRHCTSSDGRLADLTDSGEETNVSALFDIVKSRRPTDDPECRECECLPMCMGGCSYLREIGQEKCNPERYVVAELVRLAGLQQKKLKRGE